MITGTAYILRTCAADMTSYGGFVWPREGRVEAPDWSADDECGRGLHGFLWGEGDGSLASWNADAVWVVARIEQWVTLRGKVKFPSADVVFAGDRIGATEAIRAFGAHRRRRQHAHRRRLQHAHRRRRQHARLPVVGGGPLPDRGW